MPFFLAEQEEEGAVGRGARTGARRTRIDQAILDLYTRDYLNVPRAALPHAPGQETAVSVCADRRSRLDVHDRQVLPLSFFILASCMYGLL